MNNYLKIETVYNRDMKGTKKLIEGDFRNEIVEYLANCQWDCTEKIDGTNIGIVWDGHKVSFQGRTEKSIIPTHLLSKLEELFSGTVNEEMFEQRFGNKKVILFGEGYGAKIQNGEAYRPDVSFILFDVYYPEKDIWLNRENVEGIATAFNIEVVPVIFKGTIQEAVDFVKTKPKSTIGTADMEGLVCRPSIEWRDQHGNRIIVKVKVVDFE